MTGIPDARGGRFEEAFLRVVEAHEQGLLDAPEAGLERFRGKLREHEPHAFAPRADSVGKGLAGARDTPRDILGEWAYELRRGGRGRRPRVGREMVAGARLDVDGRYTAYGQKLLITRGKA